MKKFRLNSALILIYNFLIIYSFWFCHAVRHAYQNGPGKPRLGFGVWATASGVELTESWCSAWGRAAHPQERRAEARQTWSIRWHREGTHLTWRPSTRSNAKHAACSYIHTKRSIDRKFNRWQRLSIKHQCFNATQSRAYRDPWRREAPNPSVLEALLPLLLFILLLLLLRKWNESHQNEIHSEV